MLSAPRIRFVVGIIVGVLLVVWGAYSVFTLSQLGSVVSMPVGRFKGAPVMPTQIAWAAVFLGFLSVAASFAFWREP